MFLGPGLIDIACTHGIVSAFDPDGAATKLARVMADAAFKPAFDAMARLLATPNRLLIVNLGNHDLELSLPWVRSRLVAALCGTDTAARARDASVPAPVVPQET